MQKVVVGLAAVLGISVLVVAFQNGAPVDINLIGAHAHVSEAALIVGAWLSGLVATGAVWQHQIKKIKSEQSLEKWELQDVKLHGEIESDRVKQLESKIATLEVALRKALDKAKSNAG